MRKPIGVQTRTLMSTIPVSQLYRVIKREQFIEILNKAHKEFGDQEFIAQDASDWIKEEVGIEMNARSVAKHLVHEGFVVTRRLGNRQVYRLKETSLI